MIAVIFEVEPKEENKQEYLEIAAKLKESLIGMEGFISIERFESLQQPGKLLSLSFWENEESLSKWRNNMIHREGQAAGMDHIFNTYRIRAAEVVRDYSMEKRHSAPQDSDFYHERPS